MTYLKDRTDVAGYVVGKLLNLNRDSQLTMIITREPSEDYSVSCVIAGQLVDTAPHMDRYYYSELSNTLTDPIPAG
jgi:hypothetical protein